MSAALPKNSISLNTTAVLTARVIDFLSGLFVMMVLTRYLGPEMFGKYIWIVTLVMIFQPIVNFEIDKIVVRDVAQENSKAEHYFSAAITMKLFLALFFLFALLSITWLSGMNMAAMAAFSLIGLSEFFFQFWLIYVALFRVSERMEFESILTAIYRLVHVSGIIIVVFWDLGFLSLFSILLIASITLFVISSIIVRKRFFSIYLLRDFPLFRYFLKESYPLLGSTLFFILLLRLDIVLLKELGGLVEVSLYHIPHNMIMQLSIVPAALITALYPVLSRQFTGNTAAFSHLIEASEELVWLLSAPVILIFSCISHEIIMVVAGVKYTTAGEVLQLLAPGFLLFFFNYLYSNLLTIRSGQMVLMKRTIIVFWSNLLFDVMLIPLFGARGAAIAKILSYIIYWVLLAMPARKDLTLSKSSFRFKDFAIITLLLGLYWGVQQVWGPVTIESTSILGNMVIFIVKSLFVLFTFTLLHLAIHKETPIRRLMVIQKVFTSSSNNASAK